MSQERRTIRPFIGLAELEPIFEESLLFIGDEVCWPNRSVVVNLDPHEFLRRNVIIQWASDDVAFEHFKVRLTAGIEGAGFRAEDLSILVVTTSSFLKMVDVVIDLPLVDLDKLGRLSPLCDSDHRPKSLMAPYSGFWVDAYVLLNGQLEPRPLRPYLKGTWLAWTRYKVETSLGPGLLPPTPLTDEKRKELEIPAKTIRYLDFGDHDPLKPFVDQERPIFYVDDSILAQLNARKNAAVSQAFQLQLAHDFVSAVFRQIAARTGELKELTIEDVRTSLVGSIVRVAAGPGADDDRRQRILEDLRRRPELVMAQVENSIGLKDAYLRSLREEEA